MPFSAFAGNCYQNTSCRWRELCHPRAGRSGWWRSICWRRSGYSTVKQGRIVHRSGIENVKSKYIAKKKNNIKDLIFYNNKSLTDLLPYLLTDKVIRRGAPLLRISLFYHAGQVSEIKRIPLTFIKLKKSIIWFARCNIVLRTRVVPDIRFICRISGRQNKKLLNKLCELQINKLFSKPF